jgi:hypothetical protein
MEGCIFGIYARTLLSKIYKADEGRFRLQDSEWGPSNRSHYRMMKKILLSGSVRLKLYIHRKPRCYDHCSNTAANKPIWGWD